MWWFNWFNYLIVLLSQCVLQNSGLLAIFNSAKQLYLFLDGFSSTKAETVQLY